MKAYKQTHTQLNKIMKTIQYRKQNLNRGRIPEEIQNEIELEMKNLEIQEKCSQENIISRLHQMEHKILGLEDKALKHSVKENVKS